LIGGAVTALSVLFSSLIFAKMFQQTNDAGMALLVIAVYGAAAFSYRCEANEAWPEPATVGQAAE
jgi:hypothetical protein